jgi:hypothetical protein
MVPFLGAGVNLCGRPASVNWHSGQYDYLPSGRELSAYLQESFGTPPDPLQDLSRVSEYVSVLNGDGPLYDELRKIFDGNYAPTRVHRFLASVPRLLCDKGYPPRNLVVVTTNYDNVLERAFEEAGHEYEVLSYIAAGEDHGKFSHWRPGRGQQVIEIPNEYNEVSLDRRSMILKIHGAVDRESPDHDSFVITEDHYIDYLLNTDLSSLLPPVVAAKLRRSNFLFLGYGLRDWNLRVMLQRISDTQKHSYKSWAILLNPDPLDQRFWMRRDVEIINTHLEEYVAQLEAHIAALGPAAKAQGNRG